MCVCVVCVCVYDECVSECALMCRRRAHINKGRRRAHINKLSYEAK